MSWLLDAFSSIAVLSSPTNVIDALAVESPRVWKGLLIETQDKVVYGLCYGIGVWTWRRCFDEGKSAGFRRKLQ